MALGTLKVTKRDKVAGIKGAVYDIYFIEQAGNVFSGRVGEPNLEEFFTNRLRLDAAIRERLLLFLRHDGEATVPDIELSEAELSSSGLEFLEEAG